MEQLKKRDFHLASKCSFSGKDEESLEHILIHCPLVWGFWAAILSTFGASGAWLFLVRDLLCIWMHFSVRKHVSFLWWAAPLCLIWLSGKREIKLSLKTPLSLKSD